MQFNVDECIEGLFPWDLDVIVGGKSYKTRRPTLGLILQLQAMKTLTSDESVKMIGQMFDDPGPDVAAWELPGYTAAVSAYLSYFMEQNAGNSRATADRVRAAVAKQMKLQAAQGG